METDEQTTTTEEAPLDSMRASLNAAIEKVEEETDETPFYVRPEETLAAEESDDDLAPSSDEPAAEIKTDEPPAAKDDQEVEAPQDNQAGAPKIDKAPVGWKADTREEWGKLPENVRTQIATRERDIAITMQQTADERRVARTFSDTMTHHRGTLEGLGYQDPFAALQGVMSTVSQLKNGSEPQRAAAAANLIKNFGISITELDNALVSGGGSGGSSNGVDPNIEAIINERMRPYSDFMSQQQHAAQQQQHFQQQATSNEVTTFMSEQEFASDVRMDMADLLDMAAQRNQPLSLKDAYDKACLMNPQVSKIVMDRQREDLTQKTRANAASKRLAASSVSGSPSGGGTPSSGGSMEDAVKDAWSLHSRG